MSMMSKPFKDKLITFSEDTGISIFSYCAKFY